MGLFRISKQQLNACGWSTCQTRSAGMAKPDGMTTLAGTGDSPVWLSCAGRTVVVSPCAASRWWGDPNRPVRMPFRPPVWIEDVLVDGLKVLFAPRGCPARPRSITPVARSLVVLQPGLRQMDVEFTGLSFTSPERVRFKYRLEGLDPNWVEAGNRRRVTYPFLPPGDYTFHVIGVQQ